MPSPEAAHVFELNQNLLADWSADPEATIHDFRRVFETFLGQFAIPEGTAFEEVDANGVPSIWASAPGADPNRAVIHYHSGGYVMGSANGYRSFGGFLSQATGARVLLPDYRLAPEHPSPAQVEDGLAAYDYIVAQGIPPAQIVVSGDSAGGALALVVLQELRDRGGEQPSCGISMSPMADFTLTGESMTTNALNDPLVPGPALLETLMPMVIGEDGVKDHPRVSPIFGNWEGIPPLLVFAGSIETLRDDGKRAVEGAKAAGVDATYVEGEEMVHIWPTYADRLPEAREALEQIGAFTAKHLEARATV